MTTADVGPTSALSLIRTTAAAWQEALDYSDCPVHFLTVFLTIAERGEVPLNDLQELTDRSASSITRAVHQLGPGSPLRPGWGLVEAYEDPYWRRRKLVRLTHKGKRVADKLVTIMTDGLQKRRKA